MKSIWLWLCTTLLVQITCTYVHALPFDYSSGDGTRPLLFHYLLKSDPVRKIPFNHDLKPAAAEMVKAIKDDDWEHHLLRDPIGFDLVLYAYMNHMIGKDTFLDVQDYLQLQADYASPETTAFEQLVKDGRLPVRVPATSVKRIRYSEVPPERQPSIYENLETPLAYNALSWITVVEVDSDFFSNYKIEFEEKKRICNNPFNGDIFKCMGWTMSDLRGQMLSWQQVQNNNLPKLNNYYPLTPETLYLGSLSLFLHQTIDTYSMDFIPAYGELNWGHLNELRETGRNPGTLYHPKSLSNYFTPHGLYGGASAFVRHDLIHQKILGHIPSTVKHFLIWMHRQEERIIAEMDKAFIGIRPDTLDAEYDLSMLTLTDTVLADICPIKMARKIKNLPDEGRLPSTYYWPTPGQHRSLFYGMFADMDGVSYVKAGYYSGFLKNRRKNDDHDAVISLESSVLTMLSSQCVDSGYTFPTSFRIYSSLLDQMLRHNEVLLREQFDFSVNELLSLTKQLLVFLSNISTRSIVFAYCDGCFFCPCCVTTSVA